MTTASRSAMSLWRRQDERCARCEVLFARTDGGRKSGIGRQHQGKIHGVANKCGPRRSPLVWCPATRLPTQGYGRHSPGHTDVPNNDWGPFALNRRVSIRIRPANRLTVAHCLSKMLSKAPTLVGLNALDASGTDLSAVNSRIERCDLAF